VRAAASTRCGLPAVGRVDVPRNSKGRPMRMVNEKSFRMPVERDDEAARLCFRSRSLDRPVRRHHHLLPHLFRTRHGFRSGTGRHQFDARRKGAHSAHAVMHANHRERHQGSFGGEQSSFGGLKDARTPAIRGAIPTSRCFWTKRQFPEPVIEARARKKKKKQQETKKKKRKKKKKEKEKKNRNRRGGRPRKVGCGAGEKLARGTSVIRVSTDQESGQDIPRHGELISTSRSISCGDRTRSPANNCAAAGGVPRKLASPRRS